MPDEIHNAVLNINLQNYRDIRDCLAEDTLWVIELYVHWCPHCQALFATMFKLGHILANSGTKVRFAAANCAVMGELCNEELGAVGHPLVTFLYKGADLRIKSWIQGAYDNRPKEMENTPHGALPKYLVPAEMAKDLLLRLPPEFLPQDAEKSDRLREILRKPGVSAVVAGGGGCPRKRRRRDDWPAQEAAPKPEPEVAPRAPVRAEDIPRLVEERPFAFIGPASPAMSQLYEVTEKYLATVGGAHSAPYIATIEGDSPPDWGELACVFHPGCGEKRCRTMPGEELTLPMLRAIAGWLHGPCTGAGAGGQPNGLAPSWAQAHTAARNASHFSCLDGSPPVAIAAVNDGFCDCGDGSDEVTTAGCAGLAVPGNASGWRPGFFCRNTAGIPYTIAPSRVGDGVCDCCDGSDEGPQSNCMDTCEADLAAAVVPKPAQQQAPSFIANYTTHTHAKIRKETVVVEYYAPWCKHCQQFKKDWQEAAGRLFGRLQFAVVDGTVAPSLLQDANVTGFPTVLLYQGNERGPLRYPGSLTADGLVRWLEEQAGVREEGELHIGNAWQPEPPSSDHAVEDGLEMLVHTLDEWVYPGPGFAAEDLKGLQAWLEVLDANFPFPEAALGSQLSAVARLVRNASITVEQTQGNHALCAPEWKAEIKELKEAYLQRLARGGRPRGTCITDTCRMWALLHVLSLAPAAGPAGSPAPTAAAAVGGGALLDAVHGFLGRYFSCRVCQTHFLRQWDSGAYGLAEAKANTTHGPALYLWRLHNAVSTRVAAESGCVGDRRWPPEDECPECWQDGEEPWDVLAEAAQLRKEGQNRGRAWPRGEGRVPDEEAVLRFLAQRFGGAEGLQAA